jgi:hypothetical protein
VLTQDKQDHKSCETAQSSTNKLIASRDPCHGELRLHDSNCGNRTPEALAQAQRTDENVSDQRDRLRMIEFQTAGSPFSGKLARVRVVDAWLPSLLTFKLCRTASRAEAFGLHQSGIVPELDEFGRDRLNKWRMAAHEGVWTFARRPRDFGHHHAIDPAPNSVPP